MSKGRNAEVGSTYTAPNGYHYTKTKTKWRLTHHLVAEKMLGRPLQKGERVSFKDKDRTNLEQDNLIVAATKYGKENRIKDIKTKIRLLQEELASLLSE